MQVINVEKMDPHPNNPREDLGDLTELAASIKERGVLQNLTVVPKGENFRVVIGHRRLAAAKLAGVKELPCSVVEMDDKEQLSTMLLENMQRSDLTITEQAQGFQMMLDLGATEEDIAKKTGFSKTTVHHRVELTKLEPELLKKAQEDEDLQLSLTDLYELEKIDNIKVRNAILKEAYSSNNLKYRVGMYLREAKENENYKAMVGILKPLGLKEAPENMHEYNSPVQRLLTHSLSASPLKTFDFDNAEPDKCYYKKDFGNLTILIKTKDLPGATEKTDLEKEQNENDKRRKSLKKIEKEMKSEWLNLARKIIDEKIKPEGCTKEEITRKCLLAAVDLGNLPYHAQATLAGLYYDKDSYATEKQEKEYILTLDTEIISLLLCLSSINNLDAFSYCLEPDAIFAEAAKNICDILKHYGYAPSEDAEKIIMGSHDLFY